MHFAKVRVRKSVCLFVVEKMFMVGIRSADERASFLTAENMFISR